LRTETVRSTFTKRWPWNKRAPLRGFFNACTRVISAVLIRMRVIDLHNVPASGPAILMINHISWADPFLVFIAVKRSIFVMAKVEVFEDPRTRWMVGPYGSIPVHRGEVDLQAIRSATEVLQEGGLVLISPEGTLSKTGGLIQAQEGLAFLAVRTNAPVVPIAIVGSTRVLSVLKTLRRATVTVTFGTPINLNPSGEKVNRSGLKSRTDIAMRHLAALLPPDMRGVYGDGIITAEATTEEKIKQSKEKFDERTH
jgi:1-acyl-sn-glycerol-3-phosphate acyltransferase